MTTVMVMVTMPTVAVQKHLDCRSSEMTRTTSTHILENRTARAVNLSCNREPQGPMSRQPNVQKHWRVTRRESGVCFGRL